LAKLKSKTRSDSVQDTGLWHITYKFPFSLSTDPIKFDDPDFDRNLVRTELFGRVDDVVNKIDAQQGKFWIVSPESGYGKSTVLFYCARVLLSKLDHTRALPFLVRLTPAEDQKDIMRIMQREIILWFLSINKLLKEFAPLWQDRASFDQFSSALNRYSETVNKLRTQAFMASDRETELAFVNVMQILDNLRSIGTFSKYVLLIDELDKLDDIELEFFFGKGQAVFERLHQHSFVCIFSGHKSWVDKLHSGSEYTYYHGEILEAKPLSDPAEVSELVESRLESRPLYMKHQDIPWSAEGYDQLRKVSRGIPRRVIKQTTEVMNYAADQRVAEINSRIVKDAMSKGQFPKISEYLSTRQELYSQLQKASSEGSFELLPVFYKAYSLRIEKDLDLDLLKRTRIMGTETDNEAWAKKIGHLTRLGLIDADVNFRVLGKEVAEFFKFLDMLEVNYALVPEILRDLKVSPAPPKEGEPDFLAALKRCFETSSGWVSEDEIFNRFLDSTSINNYFVQRYPNTFSEEARIKFEQLLPSYLFREPNLLVIGRDFRRIEANDQRDTLQWLLELSRDKLLVGTLIEVLEHRTLPNSDRVLGYLSLLMGFLAQNKNQNFTDALMRDPLQRMKFMDSVRMPRQVGERIEFFMKEVGEPSSPSLVKELLATITRNVCDLASEIQQIPIFSERPFANYLAVRKLFASLTGHVSILDRDIDEKGFQFLYGIDRSRVKTVRILAGGAREGKDFNTGGRAFISELKRSGLDVEIRISEKELSTETHGRLIVDDRNAWWSPPLNIIYKKFDEIKETQRERALTTFDRLWKTSRVFE